MERAVGAPEVEKVVADVGAQLHEAIEMRCRQRCHELRPCFKLAQVLIVTVPAPGPPCLQVLRQLQRFVLPGRRKAGDSRSVLFGRIMRSGALGRFTPLRVNVHVYVHVRVGVVEPRESYIFALAITARSNVRRPVFLPQFLVWSRAGAVACQPVRASQRRRDIVFVWGGGAGCFLAALLAISPAPQRRASLLMPGELGRGIELRSTRVAFEHGELQRRLRCRVQGGHGEGVEAEVRKVQRALCGSGRLRGRQSSRQAGVDCRAAATAPRTGEARRCWCEQRWIIVPL